LKKFLNKDLKESWRVIFYFVFINRRIIKNNKLNLNDLNVILDFINTRQYYYFDIDEKRKCTKILKNKIYHIKIVLPFLI
jgi:hypothetical protein